MAISKIQYTCGCGYKTKYESRAQEHADLEQHDMTVIGTIIHEPMLSSAIPPKARKPKRRTPVEIQEEESSMSARMKYLRNLLSAVEKR